MRTTILTILLATTLSGQAEAAKKQVHKKSVPAFSSKSFIVADGNGNIIREKAGEMVLSIASITKLMVAILASEQDLTEELSIPAIREVQTKIPKDMTILGRKELLTLALVKSDNLAAQVLCENIPDCINEMNNRAVEIGMHNTVFHEPTGLNKDNVSTAQDLLKLMLVAATIDVVSTISSQPIATVEINENTLHVRNTNPFTLKHNITLSKTGFTVAAGGCLVMILESAVGTRILILLGSKNARTRIPDMERLINNL